MTTELLLVNWVKLIIIGVEQTIFFKIIKFISEKVSGLNDIWYGLL